MCAWIASSNLRGAIDSAFEILLERISTTAMSYFCNTSCRCDNTVPALIEKGKKVIDLSADFRLENIQQWESWYGVEHVAPDLVKQAVYGLPELNRGALRSASW